MVRDTSCSRPNRAVGPAGAVSSSSLATPLPGMWPMTWSATHLSLPYGASCAAGRFSWMVASKERTAATGMRAVRPDGPSMSCSMRSLHRP